MHFVCDPTFVTFMFLDLWNFAWQDSRNLKDLQVYTPVQIVYTKMQIVVMKSLWLLD